MFQRIAGPFREFGFRPGLVYVINRLLHSLSPKCALLYHDWMVQPIPNTPLLPSRLGRSYETKQILDGDPLIDAMPLRPGIPASRFSQGAMCLGTFRKGELVGYIWLSFETYEEDDARCTFVLEPQSESVFDFDLYVVERYRMGLAFVAIWDGASEYLRQRGIKHSYSRLDRFNKASAAAHKHLGWQRVGSAIVLKLWNLEVIAASARPYVSFLFSTKQRAVYKLVPDALMQGG